MTDTIMSSEYEREIYYLGQVKIEPSLRRVTNEEGLVTILSGPKITALAKLAEHHGEIVSRDELSNILSGVNIEHRDASTLGQHIGDLREALGDNARKPRFIGTMRAARNANREITRVGGFTLIPKPTFEAPLVWNKDPYLGLRTFQFDHHKIFFGRSAAVGEIVEYLHQKAADGCAFILVHGVSGAGKSSVVRAGVVPTLCQSSINISGEWRHAVFRARAGQGDSFDDLADAIVMAYPEILEEVSGVHFVAEKLRDRPHAADNILRNILNRHANKDSEVSSPPRFPSLALVADQLEELFTTKSLSGLEIDEFALCLDALSRSGWCYVVGTIRSDYLQLALRNKIIAKMAAGAGVYTLLPPTISELRAIIRGPLKLRKLTMEEPDAENSLSDIILQDASPNLESLAVLGFTLSELYERRSKNDVLTMQAYLDLGGLQGCIARRADKVLRSLSDEAQQSLNSVLTRLARIDRTHEFMPIAQAAEWNVVTATEGSSQLVEAFRDAHLFSVDRSRDGKRVVRVSHEAVLTTWKRAQKWMVENKHLLTTHKKIARSTEEWLENKRDTSLLLVPGLPLSEGKGLLESPLALSINEIQFVEESLSIEAATTRKELRRKNQTKVAAIIFAIVSVFATIFANQAILESNRANSEAQIAQRTNEFVLRAFSSASIENATGEPVSAIDILNRAANLLKNDHDISPLQKANFEDMMGRAYGSIGENDKAKIYLEDALKIRSGQLPAKHSDVAASQHHLGWLRFEMGETQQGLNYLLQTKEIYDELETISWQKKSKLLNDLGVLYRTSGDYDKAIILYRDALVILRAHVPSDHQDIVVTLGNLGLVLTYAERLIEAEPVLEESVAISRKQYGATSPLLADSLNQLSLLKMNLENYHDAQSLREEVLGIRTTSMGERHPATILSLNNLGQAILAQGNYELAIPYFQKAVVFAKEILGENHHHLGIYLTNYADALQMANLLNEARVAVENAIEILENTENIASWRIANAYSVMGAIEARDGDPEKAKHMLQKAYSDLVKSKGENSRRTKSALNRLQSHFPANYKEENH